MRIQRNKDLSQPPASPVSCPQYERILRFTALTSLDSGLALRFNVEAGGLGVNDASLNDLFNYALEKPINFWRMRGLEHLTFEEFISVLTPVWSRKSPSW